MLRRSLEAVPQDVNLASRIDVLLVPHDRRGIFFATSSVASIAIVDSKQFAPKNILATQGDSRGEITRREPSEADCKVPIQHCTSSQALAQFSISRRRIGRYR
jgi:hypothetical protein